VEGLSKKEPVCRQHLLQNGNPLLLLAYILIRGLAISIVLISSKCAFDGPGYSATDSQRLCSKTGRRRGKSHIPSYGLEDFIIIRRDACSAKRGPRKHRECPRAFVEDKMCSSIVYKPQADAPNFLQADQLEASLSLAAYTSKGCGVKTPSPL
jgi:hypothetical protein